MAFLLRTEEFLTVVRNDDLVLLEPDDSRENIISPRNHAGSHAAEIITLASCVFGVIRWAGFFIRDVSPIVDAGVADCDSPRRKFFEQLRYGRRNFAIARNDYRPLKIFPEFTRADAPPLQIDRRRLPDLYQRPVPGKSQCGISIRRWSADNKMIVPDDENAWHCRFTPQFADLEWHAQLKSDRSPAARVCWDHFLMQLRACWLVVFRFRKLNPFPNRKSPPRAGLSANPA